MKPESQYHNGLPKENGEGICFGIEVQDLGDGSATTPCNGRI